MVDVAVGKAQTADVAFSKLDGSKVPILEVL